MLIEWLTSGPVAPIWRNGKVFTPKADPEHGNAILCDITDPVVAMEFLKAVDKDRKPVCRRFPLEAIRDPSFVRGIQRNPYAALTVLTDLLERVKGKAFEDCELDETSFQWEMYQAGLPQLQMLAAELKLEFYAQTPEHTLIGAILPHCKTAFKKLKEKMPDPKAPEPQAPRPPEDEHRKPGRPKKPTFTMQE